MPPTTMTDDHKDHGNVVIRTSNGHGSAGSSSTPVPHGPLHQGRCGPCPSCNGFQVHRQARRDGLVRGRRLANIRLPVQQRVDHRDDQQRQGTSPSRRDRR